MLIKKKETWVLYFRDQASNNELRSIEIINLLIVFNLKIITYFSLLVSPMT